MFSKYPGLLLLMLARAECNTVQGMGKDIECGGKATQDAAKDVQQKMQWPERTVPVSLGWLGQILPARLWQWRLQERLMTISQKDS